MANRGNIKKRKVEENKKELIHIRDAKIIELKEGYVIHKLNAGYWLARCNAIAEQLEKGIEEKFDGRLKTRQFLYAEYLSFKHKAISAFRTITGIKKDLMVIYKVSEKEIDGYWTSYCNSNIIRGDYNEYPKKRNKASFSDPSKD